MSAGGRPPHWPLGLLALANLLAAVGGGRLLSAAKGVTGLAVLGSGSLLALLAGNALGLGLLLAVRRAPQGRALIGLSLGAVLSSVVLLGVVWLGTPPALVERAGSAARPGHAPLAGAVAWVFFAGLVGRCALWYAGRSVRSGLAAAWRPSWLAVAESAYFLGFIVGLLLGPVAVAGHRGVVGALLLDATLLLVVVGCDTSQQRTAPARARPAPPPPGPTTAHARAAFWRLTTAFGAATLACQVVVLHVADTLAPAGWPALAGRADQTVAAFYGGVALGAAVCAGVRPTLEREGDAQRGVALHAAGRVVRVGVAPLVALAGIPTLLGVWGLAPAVRGETTWPIGAGPSFAAIGMGAAVFEVVVLAVLASVRRAGDGLVALAFGIAATTAALGLFLMLLGGVRLPGWTTIIAGGLALAAWLLRDGERATA